MDKFPYGGAPPKVVRRRRGELIQVSPNTALGTYVNERSTDGGFLDFLRKNESKLMNHIGSLVTGWPEVINNYDYRFDKSDTMCRIIDDEFDQLDYAAKRGVVGYDMLYDKGVCRVSVKMQNEIFQRKVERSSLSRITKPKDITLRNKLSSTKHVMKQADYFDYLWAIETYCGPTGRLVRIRIAAASYGTVERHVVNSSKNDQVKCKLPNDAWDHISNPYSFPVKDPNGDFKEEKNALFHAAKDKLARELYELGRLHINTREDNDLWSTEYTAKIV